MKIHVVLIIISIIFIQGCAHIYKQPLDKAVTPDSFDLHGTFDKDGKPTGGFTGFSWDLE